MKHEEGDESRHLNTKFTVPKSWRPGPVEKLLAFAVDTYNGKHADTPLSKDGVHFELEGETLGLEDVVEQCIQPKAELLIVSGPSPADGNGIGTSTVARVIDEAKNGRPTKPRRKESGRKARSSARTSAAPSCSIRTTTPKGRASTTWGPPFFHDCNKGWTCCKGKTAMDWDDFSETTDVRRRRHSATPPKALPRSLSRPAFPVRQYLRSPSRTTTRTRARRRRRAPNPSRARPAQKLNPR